MEEGAQEEGVLMEEGAQSLFHWCKRRTCLFQSPLESSKLRPEHRHRVCGTRGCPCLRQSDESSYLDPHFGDLGSKVAQCRRDGLCCVQSRGYRPGWHRRQRRRPKRSGALTR